jgi:glycine oxidase
VTGHLLVVGSGLIGLAVAWRAAQAGLQVTLVDPAPAAGASSVAAGMLAPVTEVHHGEEPMLALTIAGARRWPGFAAALEDATGRSVGYEPAGTLLVAFDGDDRRALDDLHGFQQQLGLEVERLRSRDCRAREPLLSPRVRGGLLAHDDHQVDPRRVIAALFAGCRDLGVRTVHDEVVRIEHGGGRVRGAVLAEGPRIEADAVVVATGASLRRLEGLPPGTLPTIRPVKGQILRLRAPEGEPSLSGTVRGLVQGRPVYLVPRRDGELVVGATQEELGHDRRVTAGGVRELLDAAATLVPGIDEFTLVETSVGLRPGTPDNRPVVGPTAVEGLLVATGHHRGGVLLAPITADAVTALLVGDDPPPEMAVADPARPSLRPATSTAAGTAASTTTAASATAAATSADTGSNP